MTLRKLNLIRQTGEGHKTEFKRNLNADLPKELVAFANSSGGSIYIGIEDDGRLSGININNDLKSRVEAMARDCDPAIYIELEPFNNVLIINVPEGKDKPYRCTNGFYIRNGASSVKLSTQEIIEFIKTEGRVRFEDLHVLSIDYRKDLDEAAIRRFIRLSGISEVISPEQLLINLGLLHNDEPTPILNNAGALFFAARPARILPHAAISCVLFKGNEKVHIIDRKIFEFDILTNVDQSLAFLERHLNLSYEIKDIRRREILEIPKDVLREGIINAIAHRDYFERGANVVVEIYDNRVEISNPGGLPKGLKAENFGKYSLARNPLIAGLLHRCNYIEKAGTGIQRMREGMANAGLPAPAFEFSEFFRVTFQRLKKPETVADHKTSLLGERLERAYAIARQLRDQGILNIPSIAEQFDTTSRTIRRDLQLMQKIGWITSSGITRNKSYSLTEEGLDKVNGMS